MPLSVVSQNSSPQQLLEEALLEASNSAKVKLVVTSAAVVVLAAVLELKGLEPSVVPGSQLPESRSEEMADQVLEEIILPSPCRQFHGHHKLVANESPRCPNPYSTAVVPSFPCLLQVQGIGKT